MKDPHKLLGVQRGASADDVKKAYLKQAQIYHPDKNLGNENWAKEQFQAVSEAYETLSKNKGVQHSVIDDTINDIMRNSRRESFKRDPEGFQVYSFKKDAQFRKEYYPEYTKVNKKIWKTIGISTAIGAATGIGILLDAPILEYVNIFGEGFTQVTLPTFLGLMTGMKVATITRNKRMNEFTKEHYGL